MKILQSQICAIIAILAIILSIATSLPAQQNGKQYQKNLHRWQNMTDEQRKVIRDKAAKLSADEIQQLNEKLNKFKQLPAAERKRIEGNYQRFCELPSESRQQLRGRHQRFCQLPNEQQQQLQIRYRGGHGGPGKGMGPGFGIHRDEKSTGSMHGPGRGPRNGMGPGQGRMLQQKKTASKDKATTTTSNNKTEKNNSSAKPSGQHQVILIERAIQTTHQN